MLVANAAPEIAIDWIAAEVDQRVLEGGYDEDNDGSDSGNRLYRMGRELFHKEKK